MAQPRPSGAGVWVLLGAYGQLQGDRGAPCWSELRVGPDIGFIVLHCSYTGVSTL